MLKLCARMVITLGLTFLASNAFAEGFALYEYSARGISLGGATVARKPDPSVLAYNPALITRLPGTQVQMGLSGIVPAGKLDSTDAFGKRDTTSVNHATWMIPSAYFTHKINDVVSVGVGEFSRFGLGFEYPHNWPGRFNIYKVDLQTISVAPTLALALTDKLSVAAGVEIMHLELDLNKRTKKNVEIGGRTLGYLEIDSDINDAQTYSYGLNMSGHYQFNDQWAAGLVYRSQMKAVARGDIAYTNKGFTGVPLPAAYMNQINKTYDDTIKDGKTHATVVLPDSIAGGISWTPIPELSFEAGAVFTRWSSFHSLRIHVPEPVNISESKKDWNDVWRLNFGVEYQALDWLTLRAGYVFDQSPMNEKYEDYLVPTDDRNIYSLGAGFKCNAWTVDLAYAFIAPTGRTYDAHPAEGILKSKTKDSYTNIYSVSVGYEF